MRSEQRVADWYKVTELKPGLFLVREPADATFYILKNDDRALFIDSGLGLSEKMGRELLQSLGIKKFDVLVTHAHCDHVGLNSLAEKIYIRKEEWVKFQKHDDHKQIGKFYRILDSEPHDWKWPKDMAVPPQHGAWKPTDFIVDNQEISFGSWRFRARAVPGHTTGHTVYFDEKSGVLFLGDLIYSGTLYLHLPDSSVKEFDKSLALIEGLVKSETLVLPSHNTIPLAPSYIALVRRSLEALKAGQLKPVSDWKADDMFVEAKVYEHVLLQGDRANKNPEFNKVRWAVGQKALQK